MAKMVIDFPLNLENLKPKSCPQRRFSTSNSIIKIGEQIPAPNYLRASIGSCHDLCKYGFRRDFPSESISSKQDKIENTVVEARSEMNHGGNNVSRTKRLVPLSSREQPGDLKHKPLVRSNQSAVKQPKKAFLKSTNDVRTSRNDASRGMRNATASKKSSSLPLTTSFSGSSVKAPAAKIRTSKRSRKNVSQLKIKNSIEDCMTNKKTSCESVPEKIIHVVEPNEEKIRNEAIDHVDRCTEFSSSPNQMLKKDSASESSVPKENDSSLRKLTINMEQVEVESRDVGPKAINLRRAVSDGDIIHSKNVSTRGALRHQDIEQENLNPVLMNTVIEENASKLVKMSRNKVKSLVDAFETLINIQDSERPITYMRPV